MATMALALLLACGAAFAAALDRTFSGDGKVVTDPNGRSVGEHAARDVIAQPDGKLVAAGATFDGSTSDFALARFLRR